jgi:hypothetical protein
LKTEEGIVEDIIRDWYIKKNGGNVAAVKLKGIEFPFVDWNSRLDDDVKKGDRVRILCRFWKPNNPAIPPNFCIQEVKKLEEKNTKVEEVIKLLEEAIAKLRKYEV